MFLFCLVCGSFIQSASATTLLVATQLEKDALGISAALVFLTFVQLIIAGTYVFRFKKNHLLPGLAIILALLVTFISFILYTLYLLSIWLVNADYFSQDLIFSDDAINALYYSNGYFSAWTDPFTVFAVALVIRDRYATYFRTARSNANTSSEKPTRAFPFHVIMSILVFLAIANWIFGTASTSLYGEANAEALSTFSPSDAQIINIRHKFRLGQDLFFVQQTVNSLMILLLIPLAIMVRRRTQSSDKILNYVIYGINPILFLRFIGGIVLSTYDRRVLSADTTDALNLAFLVVPSFMYFLVFCILCFLLLRVDFWLGPEEEKSQFGPQFVPYAQFPGQWGNFQPPPFQTQPPQPFPGQWGYFQPPSFQTQPPQPVPGQLGYFQPPSFQTQPPQPHGIP